MNSDICEGQPESQLVLLPERLQRKQQWKSEILQGSKGSCRVSLMAYTNGMQTMQVPVHRANSII
jgi:hypothetical protein